MPSFYGVKRGRDIGVFDNWENAQASVYGFSNNCYKKFNTFEAAEEFVYGEFGTFSYNSVGELEYGLEAATGGFLSSPQSNDSSFQHNLEDDYRNVVDDDEESSDGSVVSLYGRDWLGEVHVDGCCYYNGQQDARAGIGVYWGENSPFNVSERLRGKQTNIRAEINAAKRAIIQASLRGFDSLHLYTDSKFLKDCYENCLYKWEENGWVLADGYSPVKNRKDWEKLRDAVELSGLELEIIYIPAHKGIAENEEADRLAKLGANKPVPSKDAGIPPSEELALATDTRVYRELVPKPKCRTVTSADIPSVVVVA